VLIVLDGKNIGGFPYRMPDKNKRCEAACYISQSHVTSIDFRLPEADEVLEPFPISEKHQ
jgi:hypothetical protein